MRWKVTACAFLLAISCVCEPLGHAKGAGAAKARHVDAAEPVCKIIYAGFVGAMETSDHKSSGVVQIRDTLRGAAYGDVCANSFMPYKPSAGLDWILEHFPSHEGPMTEEEVRNGPKIILYGHSTGGWAMLTVARELQRREIPVELTVQADSVGITDLTIPSNVKEGAIFHANDVLMFMTTKRLKLQDATKTTIVANVLVKGANHLSITRDPRIRELVLKTVQQLRFSGK